MTVNRRVTLKKISSRAPMPIWARKAASTLSATSPAAAQRETDHAKAAQHQRPASRFRQRIDIGDGEVVKLERVLLAVLIDEG